MSNPRVSIIVPVYKAADTIRRCVDSIISQYETNWELFLIDDGSPDESGKICDEYALSDKRINVVHKENGGVSSARNAGIELSCGEYISFVDADDYIDKTYLRDMLEYSPDDLIICGFRNNGGIDFLPEKISTNIYSNPTLVRKLVDIPFYLDSPWCKLFKTEIIKKTGRRFDERLILSEDTLFSYMYLIECATVSIVPKKLYTYEGVWGGGAKYSLTGHQLIEASKKNVSAINAVAKKFGVAISTRYKCFQYTKLQDIFKRFTDVDIHGMYVQTHEYISICDFLGDERLSPISLAIANINKSVAAGRKSDCYNALIELKRFVTTPIGGIKFSNRKHCYLINSLGYLGANITSVLLILFTKLQTHATNSICESSR